MSLFLFNQAGFLTIFLCSCTHSPFLLMGFLSAISSGTPKFKILYPIFYVVYFICSSRGSHWRVLSHWFLDLL